MGSAVLVREEREAGLQLLKELSLANFPMEAAYWRYSADSETWRFVIATPLIDMDGAIAAYTRLQSQLTGSLANATGISFADISLVSPRSNQITTLKKRFGRVELDPERVRRVNLSRDDEYISFLN
jgi:hypothetical protein